MEIKKAAKFYTLRPHILNSLVSLLAHRIVHPATAHAFQPALINTYFCCGCHYRANDYEQDYLEKQFPSHLCLLLVWLFDPKSYKTGCGGKIFPLCYLNHAGGIPFLIFRLLETGELAAI